MTRSVSIKEEGVFIPKNMGLKSSVCLNKLQLHLKWELYYNLYPFMFRNNLPKSIEEEGGQ